MRILIAEHDPVFATLLEDRLTLAGHSVVVTLDGAEAVRRATQGSMDLVILDVSLSKTTGLEALRALRCQPETQGLPVLLLSEDNETEKRVAALKAGADDYLAKPCDLEEVTLRADRLLGIRAQGSVALQGDLANQPLWEVIQYVVGSQRDGFLVIRGGRFRVENGRLVAARFQELEGEEALLAIASMEEGRFRFVEGETVGTPEATSTSPLPVSKILMDAAWLADELARRAAFTPPSGAPMVVASELPEVEPDFRRLPLAEVRRRIAEEPGTRLYDLLAGQAFAAPIKVRLAVAWLIQHQVVRMRDELPKTSYPNTMELSASLMLQVAAQDLLMTAQKGGHGSSVVPYFILASSQVWSQLAALIETAPRPCNQTLSQPGSAYSGSATVFEGDHGRLSLHLQELVTPVPRAFETVISVCAGVVLWVEDARQIDELGTLIERVETSRARQTGLIIAASPEAHAVARPLVAGKASWRLTSEAPRSLLGLLRLISAP